MDHAPTNLLAVDSLSILINYLPNCVSWTSYFLVFDLTVSGAHVNLSPCKQE